MGQFKFRLEIVDVFDFGQGGQLVQALEIEIVKKSPGRAQQFRPARYIAMANRLDPIAFLQRAQNVGAQGNAPNLFDFAACDRLAISNDRQRFEQGA